MGWFRRTMAIGSIVSVFVAFKILYSPIFYPLLVPVLPSDEWWGPGEPWNINDTTIRSMTVEFKDDMIRDLKYRLKNSRRQIDPMEGSALEYGLINDTLDSIIEYLYNGYNFTQRVSILNKYKHFVTNVQVLDLHYVHIKPEVENNELKVYPLLLLHGWPGSFVEFYKMANILVAEKGHDFVFEMIIPSLPGFGYSQGASVNGLGTPQVAVMMKNLMDRLGFKKFIVHGGDLGSIIASQISILYPENIIGLHTNMPDIKSSITNTATFIGGFLVSLDAEQQSKNNLIEEVGYLQIQNTKPDMVGLALQDSPVGLAAHILEKLSKWSLDIKTDSNFKDEILDNVMIYWSTNSITTSMRLHSESITKTQLSLKMDSLPVLVPTAVTKCSRDLIYNNFRSLKDRYKHLVQVTDKGCGHYLALEEPQILVEDLWNATVKFEMFYNKSVSR